MFDPKMGYPAVVPYIRYRAPEAAIAWLGAVLGATEAIRFTTPDGVIAHIEMLLGERHVITLGQAAVGSADRPADLDDIQAMTLVFVDDVDAAVERAIAHGGAVVTTAVDQPWGLRQAVVVDPEGHAWELSAHVRDVPLENWGARRTGPWITA